MTQTKDYIDQYVELSGRTAAVGAVLREDVFASHAHAAYDLNMSVEAGVNADLIKRSVFYKEPLDKTRQRGLDASMRLKERFDLLKVLQLTDKEKVKFSDDHINVIHAALGLISEAGEIMDEAIESAIEGRPLDLVNLQEEGGDSMWYIAMLLRVVGSDFTTTAKQNIEKLAKRYPDQFTSEAALNRDLAGEREVLEKQSA